jgi:hypothetical protein
VWGYLGVCAIATWAKYHGLTVTRFLFIQIDGDVNEAMFKIIYDLILDISTRQIARECGRDLNYINSFILMFFYYKFQLNCLVHYLKRENIY